MEIDRWTRTVVLKKELGAPFFCTLSRSVILVGVSYRELQLAVTEPTTEWALAQILKSAPFNQFVVFFLKNFLSVMGLLVSDIGTDSFDD